MPEDRFGGGVGLPLLLPPEAHSEAPFPVSGQPLGLALFLAESGAELLGVVAAHTGDRVGPAVALGLEAVVSLGFPLPIDALLCLLGIFHVISPPHLVDAKQHVGSRHGHERHGLGVFERRVLGGASEGDPVASAFCRWGRRAGEIVEGKSARTIPIGRDMAFHDLVIVVSEVFSDVAFQAAARNPGIRLPFTKSPSTLPRLP